MRLEGWRIAGVIAVVLMLMAIVAVSAQGAGEAAVRLYLRDTARIAVTLFLLAFTASSINAFFPGRSTAWLLRNRRYVGVSFALAHTCHLLALIALGVLYPHPFLDRLTAVAIAAGGIAYLFVLAMAVTSFAGPRRWLGARRWKALHTSGSYYVWIIFAQNFLPRAWNDPFYIPFAAALVAALVLRLVRRWQTSPTDRNRRVA